MELELNVTVHADLPKRPSLKVINHVLTAAFNEELRATVRAVQERYYDVDAYAAAAADYARKQAYGTTFPWEPEPTLEDFPRKQVSK